MSVHSTLIGGVGTPLLMDAQGESIQVQPSGESRWADMTALVGPERTVEKRTESGRKQCKQRTFGIVLDNESRFCGIDVVRMNAVIRYQLIDYAVVEKRSLLDGFVTLVGERTTVEERSARDYRAQ